MSWRSQLEALFTVRCKKCGIETIDPLKHGRQRYCQVRCWKCGYILPRRRHGREFERSRPIGG